MRARSPLCLAAALGAALPALAAPCSGTGPDCKAWKPLMAQEAQAQGVGRKRVQALMESSYATRTIGADRNQKSFR